MAGAGALGINIDDRLTNAGSLREKTARARRLVQAWEWKSGQPATFPVVVCLIGGTGTGKSTIFNSLAGEVVSDAGWKRPMTRRPVILCHETVADAIRRSPLVYREQVAEARDDSCNTKLVTHSRPDLACIVLVDTPDVDSAEIFHHEIAEDFMVLSDVVMFVTSQEKYADLTGFSKAREALAWSKTILFVMNKVTSQAAYDDFRTNLAQEGHQVPIALIERLPAAVSIIPDLAGRPEFRRIVQESTEGLHRELLRNRELDHLRQHTADSIQDLAQALQADLERVENFDQALKQILSEITFEMGVRLDALVSEGVAERVRERLQALLRKYDILFVPRMMVRDALKTVLSFVWETFGLGGAQQGDDAAEKQLHAEDLQASRSAARLEPLEAAVAQLNLRTARLLTSDKQWEDFLKVATSQVPLWDEAVVRAKYEQAFPGLEQLLEDEFHRVKEGLSTSDEIKLYGSYTLWALLVITLEIVVGGGFTMIDVLLGSAILPFIPKWVLSLKVLDMLKQIAARVDAQHRQALVGILEQQAGLYVEAFRGLLPDERVMERLKVLGLNLRDFQAMR